MGIEQSATVRTPVLPARPAHRETQGYRGRMGKEGRLGKWVCRVSAPCPSSLLPSLSSGKECAGNVSPVDVDEALNCRRCENGPRGEPGPPGPLGPAVPHTRQIHHFLTNLPL